MRFLARTIAQATGTYYGPQPRVKGQPTPGFVPMFLGMLLGVVTVAAILHADASPIPDGYGACVFSWCPTEIVSAAQYRAYEEAER